MVLSDRVMNVVKNFLQRELSICVQLRDDREVKSAALVIVESEDDPEEDEQMRGCYEVEGRVILRCDDSVDDDWRREYLGIIESVLCEENVLAEDGTAAGYELVRFANEGGEDRGIEGGLRVFDMMVGVGTWDRGEKDTNGEISFMLLCCGVDA